MPRMVKLKMNLGNNMMFQTRWVDSDAKAFIKRHAEKGINAELALRVYTSQLIGSDPDLVMHGGGNTSCKTTMPDLFGNTARVLCVKGSECSSHN